MTKELVCIPASKQVKESRLYSPCKALSMAACIKCRRGMFFLDLTDTLAKVKVKGRMWSRVFQNQLAVRSTILTFQSDVFPVHSRPIEP